MRVLLLTSSYYPHKGGVEEVVYQLARAYRARGQHVLVLAPRWPRSLPTGENVDGQIVLRMPMPLPSRRHARSTASFLLRFVPAIARILYIGLRWRPDIIHVHCIGPNGLYALVLSLLLKKPMVVTSHGEQTGDANRLYERSAIQRWVLRHLLRRADRVTAPAAAALHNLEPYGPIMAPTSVVPNGVDPIQFLQHHTLAPHRRPYLFAVGRQVWNKGFDVLLHAYARVAPRYPDVDLVLAGDGPEHENLIALARDLGVADRVHFPGRTNRNVTAAYFHHCRFFVLPSFQEAFALVNLEAMITGRAVVASSVGGVPELVRDGQNGLLVPPGDINALATAIESLLRNPQYASTLGANGARLVRARYTWDRVATAYLALYADTLRAQAIRSDTGSSDMAAPGAVSPA